ncbi:MAG TPA: prephenate dehydrogenase [Saprospiraceae bacterium]|nr:prephenate dehydrogenase [Saprospiraceae bacterium]
MKVSVIGLGLLGGSIGMRLREKGHHVIGMDHRPDHEEQALELGLVSEIQPFEMAVKNTEVCVLAIPVNYIESTLIKVLDMIDNQQVVTDTGSTKKQIGLAVKHHPQRGRYVAGHPLAGTEFSGPAAAFSTLFDGKKNLVCDIQLSDPKAVATIKKLNEDLGMKTVFMDSETHDKHLAYVSHLSHVSSFMLGLTVLDIEQDEQQIFDLAGTGFGSTVRLAKSSPETWAPIFDRNKEHLSDALGEYIEHLVSFKRYIDSGDIRQLKSAMSKANDIRRVLNG